MLYAIACFILGHTLGWYTHNLQFVNDYWKDKVLLPTVIFGIPALLAFWYGTKFAMEAVPELWTARFVAAVFSYLTFFELLNSANEFKKYNNNLIPSENREI